MFSNLQILFNRFLLALVFASICRLVFLAFNPQFLSFPPVQLVQAFYYGLAYDISALVYIHGFFIVLHLLPNAIFSKLKFQQWLMGLYILAQFSFFFFNLVDTGFYPIAGRRSGVEIFSMANETNGLVGKYLADYWYLVLLLLGLTLANFYVYKKRFFVIKSELVQTESWFVFTLLRLGVLGLAFIGARGGLNLLPLNPFDAARQTRAELIPLVINTPFNIIISTQQAGLTAKNYYTSEAELALHFNPIKQLTKKNNALPSRNIVLIIVESLGKEYVGFYNQGKGYTPFLDSLMRQSAVYLHAYANGKKSIEGIPAILSGMPSLMQVPYLSSFYQSNIIRSTGHYLQELGYTSHFYHGGKNGTMSFDNYIALSNAGKYLGKNEYPNPSDFDGFWGISDRPYLQYVAKEIGKQNSPNFTTVFTLTSHHPYQLPAQEEERFKEGTLPIHKTISYVDDALRDFFATASKEAWFNHTTFIITADHSAENEQAYYQTPQGKFEIPLLVYKPFNGQAKEHSVTVSQTDIMQIILEEANYTKPFFSFGSGLNSRDSNGCAMQFQDGYYQTVQWPYVLNFDGEKAIGFFYLAADSLMRVNQIKNPLYQATKDSMLLKTKAIIQSYHTRVIGNQTH